MDDEAEKHNSNGINIKSKETKYDLVGIAIVTLLTFITPGNTTSAPITIGVYSCAVAGILWRSKHPIAFPLAIITASAIWPFLWLIAIWALASLSELRRWRFTALGAVIFTIASLISSFPGQKWSDGWTLLINRQPINEETIPWVMRNVVMVIAATLFTIAVVAIGAYGSARREAAQAIEERRQALGERLHALQREQELIATTSRQEERTRIAREMHDVLAHKISLISLHAGALTYRDDLSKEQIRELAQAIQTSAHEALDELRTILGQLRQVEHGHATKPQPLMDSLETLIEELRAGGVVIDYHNEIDGTPPPPVSRHTYRIIQECLTNAHKHAPGTTVNLWIAGSPHDGVRIRVTNPLLASPQEGAPDSASGPAPSSTPEFETPSNLGSSLGLIGIQERVNLLSGTMKVTQDTHFTVEVHLPWRE